MVMFRTLSCGVLMLGFIVLDDFPGLVSVPQPHENAYFKDVRQSGLAFSVQLARDALALKGRFDDFRFKRIIDRVDGHGLIGFHVFHFA
jgi:hypothetical protein